MLSRRLLLKQQITRFKYVITYSRCTSQLAVDPELPGDTPQVRLSAHKPKKPTREPFAKNLCIGKFDLEFIAFPEPQTHSRHKDFFEWLKPIEDYIKNDVDVRQIDETGKIPDKVFKQLAKFGVFQAAVDEQYEGIGLNASEYTKLVETVSAIPVLGTYLIKRSSIAQLIQKFGTEELKRRILPKIASGEITPALCFSENTSGSKAEELTSTAVLSFCTNYYILNGCKTYVFDARNANFFIFMARNTSPDNFVKVSTFSAFCVQRDNKNITVDPPVPMVGQHGIDLCTVTFNDVQVPVDNVLGTPQLQAELFICSATDGKENVGGQTIGILKRFMNHLTNHVSQNKNFNNKKERQDSMHEVIGKIATNLYAMEAMTYMTTGMMDNFENQDCLIEKSLVEVFCVTACIESIILGMQLIGFSGCSYNEPFQRIMRDAVALSSFNRSTIDTKILAALMGVQYTGQVLGGNIKKSRNPLFYPWYVVTDMIRRERIPKLFIDENLHPTLTVAAQSLEASINNLRKCVETMLIRSGVELLDERMTLRRLTDIMVEIYAMTAVVSRASRAYCIGLRNAEDEVRVAMIFTYYTFEKVDKIMQELLEGDWTNGDYMLKEISESVFQNKSYFSAHPLDRNF